MPSATTSYYSLMSLLVSLLGARRVFSDSFCFLVFSSIACSGVGGVLRVCYTHSTSCLLSEPGWHGEEEREGGNMVVNAGSLILCFYPVFLKHWQCSAHSALSDMFYISIVESNSCQSLLNKY